MEFVWFNLFSTLESMGTFIFMLVLFRFKLKDYIYHVIFAAFLLSQTSFYMRSVYELDMYVPFVYIVLFFLFLWLMFHVQVFYAAIMMVIGQITHVLIQSLTLFICISLGLLNWDDVGSSTVTAYIMQSVYMLQMLGLSWIIHKKRWGFSFIPINETFYVKIKGENLWNLLLLILSIVFVSMNLFWVLSKSINLFISNLILLMLFVSWIYVGIRKEFQTENHES